MVDLFVLNPGQLSFDDLKKLLKPTTQLSLSPDCLPGVLAAEKIVVECITGTGHHYGINTGFGSLANTRIHIDQLHELQRNIILSHSVGTGELLSDEIVRLILILKINSLARGYSGVRMKLIESLIQLVNMEIYPCVPSQGSVGASGDLAPLAHLSAALLGEGEVRYHDQIISAKEGLKKAGLESMVMAPKEGLALLNGTQVSTALAIHSLLATEKIFIAGLIAGALTTDATLSSHVAFDERIQRVRDHAGQVMTAEFLRELLAESSLHLSHQNCNKVQDPYSIRCQPQVMGAVLSHIQFVEDILLHEANAVSDNPLIFADDHVILSGGNFHAEPVAMAADTLALCIAEIGALSERRIELLMDPEFSQLPIYLVKNPGTHSGFMMAQVTAAALASENKSLAHPASVDSIPTSLNQEDHVSMATFAARRLRAMTENSATIVGIELLAAAQGIDFRRPLSTSAILEEVYREIRRKVAFYEKDRYFAPDIAAIKSLVLSDVLKEITKVRIIR